MTVHSPPLNARTPPSGHTDTAKACKALKPLFYNKGIKAFGLFGQRSPATGRIVS